MKLVTLEEIDFSEGRIVINKKQASVLLQKTPEKYIKKRKAKGGGTWDYVSGGYVKKILNLMFGWNWDFEVVEYKFDLEIKQAFVLGKLKVRTGGQEITKMQFGRVDIKLRKDTKMPLDIGNDLKAATTDALKKCASELGVCADIYQQEDFMEVSVVDQEYKKNHQEEAITRRLEVLLKKAESNEETERIIMEFEAAHPVTEERKQIINNYR